MGELLRVWDDECVTTDTVDFVDDKGSAVEPPSVDLDLEFDFEPWNKDDKNDNGVFTGMVKSSC